MMITLTEGARSAIAYVHIFAHLVSQCWRDHREGTYPSENRRIVCRKSLAMTIREILISLTR